MEPTSPAVGGTATSAGLQYDRAVNAEVLQLLAAHGNSGYFVNLSVASLSPSEMKTGDAVALFCKHLLQTKLDQGGYAGVSVIGGLKLGYHLDEGQWDCEYSLVVLGATTAQIGGLWDRLCPLSLWSVRKIGSRNFDILDITDDLSFYSEHPGSSRPFGDGIEPPTPAQLFSSPLV